MIISSWSAKSIRTKRNVPVPTHVPRAGFVAIACTRTCPVASCRRVFSRRMPKKRMTVLSSTLLGWLRKKKCEVLPVNKLTGSRCFRSTIKCSALAVAKTCGLFAVMRRIMRQRLLVLCYHSVISDDSPQDSRTNIAVTKQQFESQLQILQNRWKPISLAELNAALEGTAELPDYSVFVSFDDGFRNNLTHAAPLLRQYGIPATVFLTTGLIGTTNMLWTQEVAERQRHLRIDIAHHQPTSKLKRLPNSERLGYLDKLRANTELGFHTDWQRELYSFMDWDEVRQLCSFGIDIGAHTVSHPILSSLSPDEVRRELSECKAKIEKETGTPCRAIAYPNGGEADFNEDVIDECRKQGFRMGFNLFGSRNPQLREINPLSINRVCVTRDVSMIEFERMLCLSR